MTRGMKEFHNVTTELNFCNVSMVPSFRKITTEINFCNVSAVPLFRKITTELNYDIDSYDSSFPIYQILLDFLESYSGPDILY